MHLPTDRTWQICRPLNRWVLVRADPRVKKTNGGIHLPDQLVGIERLMEGTGHVLRLGPAVKEVLGDELKEGDRICFRGMLKDAFHEFVEEDGCRVFMLRAEDVLAVIDEDVQMGAFLKEGKVS